MLRIDDPKPKFVLNNELTDDFDYSYQDIRDFVFGESFSEANRCRLWLNDHKTPGELVSNVVKEYLRV